MSSARRPRQVSPEADELGHSPKYDGAPVIRLKNLSVTYPGGVEALRGVDLSIDEGEFVVIVGLSGAGKSTLLRVLNGLVPATSGSVIVDGTEVVDHPGIPLVWQAS